MSKNSKRLNKVLILSLSSFLLWPLCVNAQWKEPDLQGTVKVGGPPATVMGQVEELKSLAALVEQGNQRKRADERSDGTASARDQLKDENDDKRADKGIEEAWKQQYKAKEYANAVANAGPKTSGLGRDITRIGVANVSLMGGTMAQDLTSSIVADQASSINANRGSGVFEKNWVALACNSGGMPKKMAQMMSSGGVSCSSGAESGKQKIAGGAIYPSAWEGRTGAIKGEPGEKDMDAIAAMILLGGTGTGNIPTGDKLRGLGGNQLVVQEAANSAAAGGYAACITRALTSKFAFKPERIGEEYKEQKAVLKKAGRDDGQAGYSLSQEELRLAKAKGRSQSAADRTEEPDSNANDAQGLTASFDVANEVGASASTPSTSNCMSQDVKNNIVANLQYFTTPEFMLALKDGSFARDVNIIIAELPERHKRQQIQFANNMREYVYGVTIKMYAENDEEVLKNKKLADVFSEVGVDAVTLIPNRGELRFAGLMPLVEREKVDAIAGAQIQLALQDALPTLQTSDVFDVKPLLLSADASR